MTGHQSDRILARNFARLGLAVSNQLVERHGGSTEVESAVGKSSTLTMILPTEEAIA